MHSKPRETCDENAVGDRSVEAGTTVLPAGTPQAMPSTAEASFPRFSIKQPSPYSSAASSRPSQRQNGESQDSNRPQAHTQVAVHLMPEEGSAIRPHPCSMAPAPTTILECHQLPQSTSRVRSVERERVGHHRELRRHSPGSSN